MPVNTRQFLDAVAILTDEHAMRVTLKESGKGALLCGTACFIGGILLGPVGLAAGGITGALAAAHVSRGKFRSVGDIIRNDLTERQREQIVEHIIASVADFQITDLAILLPLLASDRCIQVEVLKGVTGFLTNQMRMQLID